MYKAYIIGPQPLPKSEEIVVSNNLTIGGDTNITNNVNIGGSTEVTNNITIGGNTYITGVLYVSGVDVLQYIQSIKSDIDGGSASTYFDWADIYFDNNSATAYFERADNYINGGTALNG